MRLDIVSMSREERATQWGPHVLGWVWMSEGRAGVANQSPWVGGRNGRVCTRDGPTLRDTRLGVKYEVNLLCQVGVGAVLHWSTRVANDSWPQQFVAQHEASAGVSVRRRRNFNRKNTLAGDCDLNGYSTPPAGPAWPSRGARSNERFTRPLGEAQVPFRRQAGRHPRASAIYRLRVPALLFDIRPNLLALHFPQFIR